MTRSAGELRELLQQAGNMPQGDGRIALLETVVRHADAAEDERIGFDARMALTSAYQHGGETGKGFVTFSWCLAAYDREPGRFTAQDDGLLRWHYKWVADALKRFPEVPLDRSYRALDDMERRYRAGGHSLHAVYALRCGVENHLGNRDAADEWFRQWCAAPRDENSDCIACDPTSKVYHLAQRNRDEEAVATAAGVLAGRITCWVQPQSIQAALLLPYLRTGRLEEAKDAHRRGYRAIRGNRDYLQNLGEHLQFCALTGNHARGLDLLERHLSWYDRPPDPMALLEAAGSGALLLRRLREAGHAGQKVRRPPFGERPAAEVEVAELEAELVGTAQVLAAKFDERNGTRYQSEVLAEKLDADPLLEQLPLSRATQRRAVAPPSSPAPAPVDELDGLTPEQLLDLAEERYAARRAAAADAAWERYDALTADAEPPPILAARRLDGRALQRAMADDLEAARQGWQAAAEQYAALGEEVRRQQALGRLSLVLAQLGETDEGVALAESTTAYLTEHGSPRQAANAELRRSRVHLTVGKPALALPALDAAAAANAELADAAQRGRMATDVALTRAMALAGMGPEALAEAIEQAALARHGCREDGDLPQYARASLLYAQLLGSSPDAEIEPVVEAYAEAARHAEEPELRLAALTHRGAILAGTDRAEEAVDDLVEVVALYAERGAPAADFVRLDLALALANTGRFLDAAETAEEGLAGVERLADTGDPELPGFVANFRQLLVQLYRQLEEKADVLAQLEALSVHFAEHGPPQALAQVHEDAAEALDLLDRDAAAAERFGVAAEAWQAAGEPFGATRCRRRTVRSLFWAGDPEASLALAEQVERELAAFPHDAPEVIWERAAFDLTVARVLPEVGRGEEGVARARAAAAGFRKAGAEADAESAEQLAEHLAGSQ